MQEFADKNRKEEEREAQRLQLILEKRRKGKSEDAGFPSSYSLENDMMTLLARS